MEIKIPEVGESVREALVARWFKASGTQVAKDEAICELETDKITLDIHADAAGTLSILVDEGTTVAIGTTIGTIAEGSAAVVSAPHNEPRVSAVSPNREREAAIVSTVSSPSVRRAMRESGIDPAELDPADKQQRISLDDLRGRITENPLGGPDQVARDPEPLPIASRTPAVPAVPGFTSIPQSSVHSEEAPHYLAQPTVVSTEARNQERHAMTPIRRRIAERLVAARQQTAMLTTFNEVDMGTVRSLLELHRDSFRQRYGIKLGYMSFFVTACCQALMEFPAVNSAIIGDDIVRYHYCDIGVAIGSEKGLVVPVLRNAEMMKPHEIERAIDDYSEKIRTNRLTVSELEGGTFSISNGGVYGSMLSTPIINLPQSAVLGMHAIKDRPVVVEGQIVIRPMMYLALSYDHRIIDGREAVNFLAAVKGHIEQPGDSALG